MSQDKTPPYRRKNTSYITTQMSEDGLFIIDPHSGELEKKLTGSIQCISNLCGQDGKNWGKQFKWQDKAGVEHTEIILACALLGNGRRNTVAKLADGGFEIYAVSNSDQEAVIAYLIAAKPVHESLLRVSNSVGWVGPCFVLPNRCYGSTEGQSVMFSGTHDGYQISGSLAEWQENTCRKAVGNSRVVFVISAAFLGPLLRWLPTIGNPGFHFHAATSLGKSTLLQVAASVSGHPASMVNTWSTTQNALETLCIARNDGALIIDEIGHFRNSDLGASIYKISEGVGKKRLNADSQAQADTRWKAVVLSAGEENPSEKMTKAGDTPKGGQNLRLLSLPADTGKGCGVFETIHDSESAGAFADSLKLASTRFHGVAADAFLRQLVLPELQQQLDGIAVELHASYAQELISCLPANAPADMRRSLDHFAAVAFAGELATLLGITGWPEGTALNAIKPMVVDWIKYSGRTDAAFDDQQLFIRIRRLLEAHGSSRFPDSKTSLKTLGLYRDRLGFCCSMDKVIFEYWVLPEQFDKVFLEGVADKNRAKQVLADKGWLLPDRDGHMARKRKLPTSSAAVRVYVLSSAVCLGDEDQINIGEQI